MPSHFSTIGFPIESEDDMYELAAKASESAEEIACESGRYLKWSSPEGAQLWLQVDGDNDLVGMTPSFSGESVMAVNITHEVIRSGDSPFEGAVHGWVNPDDTGSGDYPFIFDLVDKAQYGALEYPFISEVTLSAFAHELTVYDSEEEYDAVESDEPKFAVESFIPAGLFTEEDPATEEHAEPQSFAVFTGRILKQRECTNPLSGAGYHWALVKTLGGTIDLVIDPELVEKPLKVGGVVSGYFWLNGKIQTPKKLEPLKKSGFISRLFSR